MTTLKVPVTAADHIQGNEQALVTLVEYGDYECPFCALAYVEVKRLQRHFGAKLRFVFRNFPLNESHEHAELAAETAEYAAVKGHFWEMHDLLYENQKRLGLNLMVELTEKLGLSTDELQVALENGTYVEKIKQDFMGGVRSGVNGTPAFYINGQRHDDTFDYDVLISAIDKAMI